MPTFTPECTVQDNTRIYESVVDDIDSVPTLFSAEQVDGAIDIYTHYRIDTRYENIENVLQMPVASEPAIDAQESEFAVVAQPMTRKVVAWTAERLGDWPKLPAKFTNVNEVVVREHVVPAAPEPMPGGTDLVYRVSGTYWYGLRIPSGPGFSLGTGLLPYVDGVIEDNAVPDSVWSDGILG